MSRKLTDEQMHGLLSRVSLRLGAWQGETDTEARQKGEQEQRGNIRSRALEAQQKYRDALDAAKRNGASPDVLRELETGIDRCGAIAEEAMTKTHVSISELNQRLRETMNNAEPVAVAVTASTSASSNRTALYAAQLSEQQYAERSADIARSIEHTYAIDHENRSFADNLARKHGIDLTPFDKEREEIERKRKEAEEKGQHLEMLKQSVLEGNNTLNRLYAVPDEKLTEEERKARDKKAAEQVEINQQRLDAFKQQAELDAQKKMPQGLDADPQMKWREDFVKKEMKGLETEIDKLHGKVPDAVIDQLSAIKAGAKEVRAGSRWRAKPRPSQKHPRMCRAWWLRTTRRKRR